MKARNLLAQRKTALAKTQRQIQAIEETGDDRYLGVLDQLRIKERRQAKAVADAEVQAEIFNELEIDF